MLKQLSQSLLSQKQIVEVVAVHGDGTVTVRQGNRDEWRVVGSSAVGDMVYVRDGAVLGKASQLASLVVHI